MPPKGERRQPYGNWISRWILPILYQKSPCLSKNSLIKGLLGLRYPVEKDPRAIFNLGLDGVNIANYLAAGLFALVVEGDSD